MWRSTVMLLVLTEALASPAFAHTDVGQADSFVSGIAHPLGGVDHILAISAVSLWAVIAGGRTIWTWPTTFVATMLAGFAAASLSVPMPLVEPVILSSVVILGMLVAFALKPPLGLGAAIVGFFGFFHGHAHGAEATAADLVPYAVGFAFATAALHSTGVGLGVLAQGWIGRAALRTMGGLTVFGGVALIAVVP
jgi:urease accessory protein